jgi:hypothetical protein
VAFLLLILSITKANQRNVNDSFLLFCLLGTTVFFLLSRLCKTREKLQFFSVFISYALPCGVPITKIYPLQTTTSPPPKLKNDRRTSWGMPLTLSRSSVRQDSSSRTSMESMPNPMQPRQRAASLTVDTHIPTKPPLTGDTLDDDNGAMSAPGILDNLDNLNGTLPSAEARETQQTQYVQRYQISEQPPVLKEPELGDDLRIPAPIGKNQPSWDPFNATPIAEEEGYQFQEYKRQQSHPMHTADQERSLGVLDESGPRLNISDAPSQEEPADLNDDWVMVSKEPESQAGYSSLGQQPQPPKTSNIIPTTSKIAESFHGVSDATNKQDHNTLSVLNRPRGESYTSVLDRPRFSYDIPRAAQEEPVSAPAASAAVASPEALVQSSKNVQPEYRPASVSPAPQPQRLSPPKNISREPRPPPINTSVQAQNISPGYSIQPSDVQSQYKAPMGPPPGRSEVLSKNVLTKNRPPFVDTSVTSGQATPEEPQSTTSFKGLPPIRRTSTFGMGFSSRQAKKKYGATEEIESELVPSIPTAKSTEQHEAEIATAAGIVAAAGIINAEARRPSQENIRQPQPIANQPDPTRPPMAHGGSTNHTAPPQVPAQMYNAPRAADYPTRKSQDSWRPNVIPPQSQAPSSASLINRNEAPPRVPMEQNPRRISGQSLNQIGRPVSIQAPARSYETPPSAAQRYPGLFRPEQPDFEGVRDDGDMPAHHYQPPIPREDAFLPRQQTNEYSLPGVGPPTEEPRPASRRNSGVWGEIGSKLRRASMERGNSVTREPGMSTEYAESSIASEDIPEQRKLRSFFGVSRAGVALGPPQSRDSMVAHHPGSRTDLMLTPAQSPISTNERKKSFFGTGNLSTEQKSKPNKLSRMSLGSTANEEPGKKRRFSGLSSAFSRSKDSPVSSRGSATNRPQATRELSHHERQPLESPAPNQHQFPRQQAPSQNPRASLQKRSFLTKISSGGDAQKPREQSKTHKPSTSLLGGIMGRRSNQQEKHEDSSSQSTRSPARVPPARTYTDLQEQSTPPAQKTFPAPRRENARAPVASQPQLPPQLKSKPQPQPQQREQERDRGRRSSRGEPRYDNVPIPGGYSLVRGDGAMSVQTDYDPRGLNRTSNPQSPQETSAARQDFTSFPGGPRRFMDQAPAISPPPPQSPVEHQTSQSRTNSSGAPIDSIQRLQYSSRRMSREDMLARSPARTPSTQQRPYQLSLPEDIEDRDDDQSQSDKNIPIISPPSSVRSPSSIQTDLSKQFQHSSVQRLNQPTLRHPESPAGYPLPDDTVYSPINPSANNLPPPPPPKWPKHLDNQDHHHLNIGLDRSNTRHTAVSAISGMSSPPESANMLAPQRVSDPNGRDITPSPTPPSPGYTPPPSEQQQSSVAHTAQADQRRSSNMQPISSNSNIQTTTLQRGHSPDLYNASPRLPKPDKAQEEKIYYNPDRLGPEPDEEHEPAAMSATSYPGQEWNPYAGVYDDGYD